MITLLETRRDRGTDWYEESMNPNDAYSAIVVSYGKCVYWLGGEKIILEKGDLLFIPDQTQYYAKTVPSVFHEKYVVKFTLTEDSKALPFFLIRDGICMKLGLFEWSLDRLKTLLDEWSEQAPFANLRCEAIVTELAVLWNRQLTLGKVSSAASQMAERMKAFIAGHYREKVTKEELGAIIGRTPNHAAALFRRVIGQTISEFVHTVRMKTAVYMLTDSLLTVAEISDFLGYRDVSYFQKIFKRTTGRTPSDFMKERSLRDY